MFDDDKSDLWSLGLLAFEMATLGEKPFDGDNFQELCINTLTKEPNFNHPNLANYSEEFISIL